MRVALDAHEVLDADFTVSRDAAHIVPGQVHQHHMFRPLLSSASSSAGERRVFLGGPPAGAGAGDRTGLDGVPLGPVIISGEAPATTRPSKSR